MNPVLILTHNNLELTKKCVHALRNQDIPVSIHVYDNESTDGTKEWLETVPDIIDQSSGVDLGVSAGWNFVLDILFSTTRDGAEGWNADHVLVVGNDTVLAPWTYSALIRAGRSFVTGVDIGMDPLPEKPDIFPLSPHPDFSCFLIWRDAWEKIGPFDERIVNYCSDCDYHVRAHRLGIPLWKASVPYNHERSSTMRNADPTERERLYKQADADRVVFKSIYGCLPGTKEYEQLFES